VKVDSVGRLKFQVLITQGGDGVCFEVEDTNALVEGVGDEKSAIGVKREIMHAIEAGFSGVAAIACGNVAEFFAARGFGAGNEGELVVFETEDAVAIFIFHAVDGTLLIEDDGEGFGDAGDDLRG